MSQFLSTTHTPPALRAGEDSWQLAHDFRRRHPAWRLRQDMAALPARRWRAERVVPLSPAEKGVGLVEWVASATPEETDQQVTRQQQLGARYDAVRRGGPR
jgi:hypothetical protein